MFTAALLTIAKIWKQSKCPSTEEWIKKMQYIYFSVYRYRHTHMQYHSVIKKNKKEILPFAITWMDLEVLGLVK